MTHTTDDDQNPHFGSTASETAEYDIQYIKVDDLRSASDEDTCLRPLGLCELGGSCDSCWYRPDHPRFQK